MVPYIMLEHGNSVKAFELTAISNEPLQLGIETQQKHTYIILYTIFVYVNNYIRGDLCV